MTIKANKGSKIPKNACWT